MLITSEWNDKKWNDKNDCVKVGIILSLISLTVCEQTWNIF